MLPDPLGEAKPEGTPLSGVEWQSAMYAEGLPADVKLAALSKDGMARLSSHGVTPGASRRGRLVDRLLTPLIQLAALR